MLMLDMLFVEDNTANASFWSFFDLSSLLLLFLVLIFSYRPVMALENQIRKTSRLLSKWVLCEKTDKKRRVVRFGLLRPDLHGMDNHEIKALEFLEHGTCSLLGVHGIRGVGKSTLLRLVRDTCAHYDSFDHVFYARAGDGSTVRMLQDVLATSIGLDLPLHTSDISIAKIISGFLRDKTFLLLLDDVWERFDLAAIGLPVPLEHRQKVILATRNRSICTEMGCEEGNTIQMQCLGEEAAWDLFRHNVGDEIIDDASEIKELAKQIVAKCQGFPGPLCIIGRIMSMSRDVKDWRVAYDILTEKRPLPNEIHDMRDEVYSRLQFFKEFCGLS